jgi:hypothetical protein
VPEDAGVGRADLTKKPRAFFTQGPSAAGTWGVLYASLKNLEKSKFRADKVSRSAKRKRLGPNPFGPGEFVRNVDARTFLLRTGDLP